LRALDLDLGQWDPWTPAEIAGRLRGVEAQWYVLAGWALDLFLGRQTREHEDLEIGVSHDEFPEIRSRLGDLELVVIGDGRAWAMSDESLAAHRQTWGCEPGGPWRLDVIRERWDGDEWPYRRDPRIRLPGTRAIARTSDGIPFLRPEVVLLFKAKAVRPKDQLDFEIVLPELEHESRAWLIDALGVAHPGHPWIDRLGSR
jgi:hypothetical protein